MLCKDAYNIKIDIFFHLDLVRTDRIVSYTNECYLKLLYIRYVVYLKTVFNSRENKIIYSKRTRKLKITYILIYVKKFVYSYIFFSLEKCVTYKTYEIRFYNENYTMVYEIHNFVFISNIFTNKKCFPQKLNVFVAT